MVDMVYMPSNRCISRHQEGDGMALDYPSWVCSECAEMAGGRWPDGHVGTFHSGICHVCGETKAITEPRDFGYPKLKVNHDAVELSRRYYESLNRGSGAEEEPGKCS